MKLPWLRDSLKRWKARKRRAEVEKQKAHAMILRRERQIKEVQGDPIRHAISWALDQVGVTESPPGSNRGRKIDQWNLASGVSPGPAAYWCQSFANAVLVHGDGPQLKSAYTVQIVQWAREGRFGLKIVPGGWRNSRAGDFVFYKFPGVSNDFCDHVGVRLYHEKTIEGNTSPAHGGSQNNGGGVFIRDRGPGMVVAVVRPTYGRNR